VRHVIKPSVSFSYVPAMEGQSAKMYKSVQTDTTGNKFQEYSIFEGSIYGTPSMPGRSGNVSFSLVNIIEAKVFARDDTTGKPNKVKIIDNFGINTSYNIFADSMRWLPVTMQMRTTLFNNINISANSSFSLYGLDSNGRPTGTFLFEQNKRLMRLTSFSTSLDLSLNDLLNRDKEKKQTGSEGAQNALGQILPDENGAQVPGRQFPSSNNTLLTDKYGYSTFDVPWRLNLSYSLNYYKEGFTSTLSQTVSFSGNVSVTKKMAVTYTSGYDITAREITMTQIGMTRDLHCWVMSFNWVPNGSMQSWNFTIRVKASVLGDLKYERRKDYHDNY
jgi:hypothetical protein